MLYQNLQINSGAGTIAARLSGPIGAAHPEVVDETQAKRTHTPAPAREATVFTAIGEILSDMFARALSSNGTSAYGGLVLDTPHRMAPQGVRR